MDKNLINNEMLLNKVNKYIDKVTYKLDKNTEEVTDYIEEMKSNIISSIQDLTVEGYNDENAFNTAIERFGNIGTIQNELNHFYKTKKFIGKSLLIIAIISLVIGVTLYTISLSYDKHIQSIYYRTLLAPLTNKVGTLEEPITVEMEDTLKSIVNNNSFIESGALYITKIDAPMDDIYRYGAPPPYIKHKDFKFNYLYPSNDTTKQSNYFSKDTTSLIFKYYTDDNLGFQAFNGQNIIIQPVYKIKSVSNIFYQLCGALILVYWITFTIWAGMNILYSRKNKLWVVLVIFTNILGYLLYEFCQHIWERKTI